MFFSFHARLNLLKIANDVKIFFREMVAIMVQLLFEGNFQWINFCFSAFGAHQLKLVWLFKTIKDILRR